MPYHAPLADMRFALEVFAERAALASLPGLEDASLDTVEQVLAEAAKLAGEVFEPLNAPGDQEGARLENGVVRTAKGFAQAYRQFVEGGWNALSLPPDKGGQGLPRALAFATTEMWNAANLSLALCPLLNGGAIELLAEHGSKDLQDLYLPKMATGEWAGTMNLTEPQAGTDLGQIRTRAVKVADGSYRLKGQKIYITYGEHDMAENIVHMVLARTPEAPAGVKGISLFLVPKYLPKADGTPGPRNDLRCVALEHKLGIKASPTCVMAHGDGEGAIGFLIGEENRGLEYMFTMMNQERLGVGIQGLGLAERAYQLALDYARQRRQSRSLSSQSNEPAVIIEHPDVRRNLLSMRAQIEAARALAYAVGGALDRQSKASDPAIRLQAKAIVEVLIPVVKAWLSEIALDCSSRAIQIHGGAGFIEASGAPQLYRDARILPIYEGTNGVQALDLLLRKMLRDEGQAFGEVERWLDHMLRQAEVTGSVEVKTLAARATRALDRLHQTAQWLLRQTKQDALQGAAVATPFLQMLAITAGACLSVWGAAAAAKGEGGADSDAFKHGKIAIARFYLDNILPQAEAEARRVMEGGASLLAIAPSEL